MVTIVEITGPGAGAVTLPTNESKGYQTPLSAQFTGGSHSPLVIEETAVSSTSSNSQSTEGEHVQGSSSAENGSSRATSSSWLVRNANRIRYHFIKPSARSENLAAVANESQSVAGSISSSLPVAEAKPSFFTRMLISMLKLFSSESDSFVDIMRRVNAVKNAGFALFGIGAASLAVLFPPAAPFAVSTLLLLGAVYFLLDWFEPQISKMAAELITKVIENQSPEVKDLGTGFAGAFITNNQGGSEMDDLAVSVAGAVISYAADRLDQPAATAVAATTGIAQTVSGANRTNFLYNDLPCVKASSSLGVLSCMGVLGFKIDNSEEAAKIALTSAQFVDQHRSLIIALFSRDVTTAGGIILGNRMVAYVSENILPEWAQKTAVASAFRTVCSNAVNYYVMGFTGGVVAPTLLTLLAGPAISALVAYDKKTGGRLEEQTQYFLEEGRKNVKNAVESMELVATHAPENALKVMKLARENTWNAITTLLNGAETPVEEADPAASTWAKAKTFFIELHHNLYEQPVNGDLHEVLIEEID
ncbi:hypothetical protein Rin_00004960 [Candidatus Regiella insecticola 5.15]|uniref:Uncharacterized protein n=1 Tax=Candidatus Regiella insecticola 5.15 TaxID=1005043 RepID=G2GXK4_9ENTR|nr:hypothetical protein [Candidatus Regiella insecticola]EGY29524.1 hypothetical protein Rin_00004960 [Candidatus Regiella insecticola 5.15]